MLMLTRWPARARGAPAATPTDSTSPGTSVMMSLTSAISRAAERISPAVLARCTVWPSRATLMPSASGEPIASRVVTGPMGQKVSRALKRSDGR